MKNKFFNILFIAAILCSIVSFSAEYSFLKGFFAPRTYKMQGSNTKVGNSQNGISAEEAKDIALNHAKVPKASAKFTKIKLDMENGISVYEIEFFANNKEYEYSINRANGKIVEFEVD